jgi:hypothetical protein
MLYPVELRALKSNQKEVVGVERFELPTSCSQSRRATRLRYTPKMFTYAVIPHGAIILPCLKSVNFFPESRSP